MESHIRSLFSLLLPISSLSISPNFNSLGTCCTRGELWADTDKGCDEFQVPVSDVIPEMQAPCISTMELCCAKARRETQCKLGRSAALSALECGENEGAHSETYKECCLSCTLGIVIASMANKCDSMDFTFGCNHQSVFQSCCQEFLAQFSPALASNSTEEEEGSTSYTEYEDVTEVGGDGDNDKCPRGFQYNPGLNVCDDINECVTGTHDCSDSSLCYNTIGSWDCDYSREEVTECPSGYRFFLISCIDINECLELESPCTQGEVCFNTEGNYTCQEREENEVEPPCPVGYHDIKVDGECKDIDECRTGEHNCQEGQRCSNTLGSFTCVRFITCGTGYTLNFESGECEDNDECALGQHNCAALGPGYLCRNIQGSFRCERKQCNVGEILDENGLCNRLACAPGFEAGPHGHCLDIDECQDSTVCNFGEKCINRMGTYECLSSCGIGLRLDSRSGQCIDIDECSSGLSTCFIGSTCINTIGSFRCECNPGYEEIGGRCEDIDECKDRMVCGRDSECQNSPGSFRCVCAQGFRNSGRNCVDVNECTEVPNMCAQQCTNLWGSHRCHCNSGYKLASDQRSCTDIDECEEEGRCVGTCVNSPGSYSCTCPPGYRLSSNQKQCLDIDECEGESPCEDNHHCFNTRGGHKCQDISCPQGYMKESAGSSRCKRISRRCRTTDFTCLRKPVSISFNFLSLVSRLTISGSGLDLFTMQSARYEQVSTKFTLRLINVDSPTGIRACNKGSFRLKTGLHQATVTLSDTLQGPQDIELELLMEMYYQARFTGSAIARIYIFVTPYQF